MLDRETFRVAAAAALGVAPGALFIDGITPVLNALLLAAQIVVAVVSALYIYSKWKKNQK